jgi:hypothetical protein
MAKYSNALAHAVDIKAVLAQKIGIRTTMLREAIKHANAEHFSRLMLAGDLGDRSAKPAEHRVLLKGD